MIRGLVIGKFMPVHNGHIALINFAASQCDELIVSMSYTDYDTINFQLRFNWVKEIFADQPGIKPHLIKDDFDNELLPLRERTRLWANKMKQQYPKIDVIFSSENYGESFAENLGTKHVSFDAARIQIPVSATLIRTKPLAYWNYIPKNVQPYFVKKICFFGPESTGKTYLSNLMAEHYKTSCVAEAARNILESNVFTEDDIVNIALTHNTSLQLKLQTANKLLFCDTDVITTQIYSQHYLGVIPPMLHEIENNTKYDLYFLMNIDAPWVADPLRDLGERREEMMHVFKTELDKRKITYIPIQGSYEQREKSVKEAIDSLFRKF